jgi:hypothetical protein
VLADGVFTGEVLASEGLGDDDLGGVTGPLIAGESVAVEEGDSDGAEVTGVAPAMHGILLLALRQQRMLGDDKATVATVAVAWDDGKDETGCIDPGHIADADEQGLKEIVNLRGLLVTNLRKVDVELEDVPRKAAEIGGAEARVAFDQESRADEQDDGQGDFEREEDGAEANTPAACTLAA